MPSPTHVADPRGGTIGNPNGSQYVSPTDRPSGQIPPIMGGGPSINYGGGLGINPDTINAINDSWLQGHNEHYGGQQWNWGSWAPSSNWIAENRPNWTGYDSSGNYYSDGQVGSPPPGTPGAPGTPGDGTPGTDYVSTTITPEPIYSQQHIQDMTNQGIQQAWQGNSLNELIKPYISPGRSVDEGMLSQVIPQQAAAASAANVAQQMTPVMAGYANDAALASQNANQMHEFVGLANILRANEANQSALQNLGLGFIT